MVMHKVAAFLLITCVTRSGAQDFFADELRGSLQLRPQLRNLQSHSAPRMVADSPPWYIGAGNPDETVVITGSQTQVGDIIILITHAVLDSAQIEVSDMRFAGEFLSFHNSRMHFSGVDTLLIWLVLPEGSVVHQTLPGATLVPWWRFATGEPGVQGIPYEINVDSCRNVLWGLVSMAGSTSTFRQSTLRVIGLFFAGNDTVRVNNLVNGSSHGDDLLPVPDRNLRLIDSKVNTWNFYPSAGSRVEITSCIFGEILAQDSSYVVVYNSVCDGSGGYVGALGCSFMILYGCLVQSPVISRDSGILVGGQSAFLGSNVTADELAAIALFNTSYAQEPVAYTAGVIFDEKLPAVRATVGEVVPLLGSARMLVGPQNPLHDAGYEIDYTLNFDENGWTSIVPRTSAMVREDTLGVWNTAGLPAGVHGLRLRLFGDFGEPITLVSSAQLFLPTGVDTEEWVLPATFTLDNYPNPFNAATTFKLSMPSAGLVRLRIFNLSGQEVTRLLETPLPPGVHTIDWQAENLSSGIYFAVLAELAGNGRMIMRRVLLVK